MNPIFKWSGVVALVIAIIACFLPAGNGQSVATKAVDMFGNVVDTSYFDIFDATTAYKLGHTTFFSSSGFVNPYGTLYTNTSATSTIATTQTLIVSDVQGYDTVILTPNVMGSDVITFFASSTASSWLPAAGNTQRTCFVNGTTTAQQDLVFAGGTGTKLLVASSSVSTLGSTHIAPQKMGCFIFTRGNATATTFDILASFTAYQ